MSVQMIIFNVLLSTFMVYNLVSSVCVPSFSLGCFDGKLYKVGHYNLSILKQCDVEPADKDMSFADSVWTIYDCLVRGLLGGVPLSRKSYLDMMARNLSKVQRERIWTVMNNDGLYDDNDMDKKTNLTVIRSYYMEYFRSVIKASNAQHAYKLANNKSIPILDIHLKKCEDGEVPAVFLSITELCYVPKPNSYMEFNRCMTELRTHLGNRTTMMLLERTCHCITRKTLKLDDIIHGQVDYKQFIKKLEYKFWPVSVKKSFESMVLASLNELAGLNANKTDANEIFSLLKSTIRPQLNSTNTEGNSTKGIEAYYSINISQQIQAAANYVKRFRICGVENPFSQKGIRTTSAKRPTCNSKNLCSIARDTRNVSTNSVPTGNLV